MKKITMKSKALVIALLTLSACSAKQEKGVEREFGGEFNGVASQNFHAHDTSMGACDRVAQLNGQLTASSDVFSVLDKFSFELDAAGPKNFKAGVKTGESPLFMHVLGSDKVKPLVESDTPSFLDFTKVDLKIGKCELDNLGAWGMGCKGLWAQTAGAVGCKLDDVNLPPQCRSIWSRVLVAKEIGKCAYVENSPPNEGDVECTVAKAKWDGINNAVSNGQVHAVKNGVLVEKFPGIFGGEGDASKSLFLGLVGKVRQFYLVGTAAASRIVTSKLPLFPADRTWSSLRQDMEISTGAWVRGTTGEQDDNRLCAFVLAQRAFAQLLAVNGFLRPDLNEANALPLAADRNSLGTVPVPGAFLTGPEGSPMQPTILSPAVLGSYNPATQLILGAIRLPKWNEAPSMVPEGLTERLERILALELFFEATSPIASWVPAGQPYLLGDLENRANSAILPYEAHGLAFGHLALDFKNLAFVNIKPIKADGSIVTSPNDTPLGFVLMRSLSADFKGEMRLSDLAKLAKVVVRLDAVLAKTLAVDPAELADKNPFYSAALRPKLEEMFARLRSMKLPLQALMYQMRNATDPRNGRKFCASKLIMDIAPVASGLRRIPVGECQSGDAVDREYQEARRLLTTSLFQETASR